MSRFSVDPDRLRSTGRAIEATLEGLAGYGAWRDRVGRLAVASAGSRAGGAIEHFLSEWDYGFERIAEDATAIGEALGAAAAVYDATEMGLLEILTPAVDP